LLGDIVTGAARKATNKQHTLYMRISANFPWQRSRYGKLLRRSLIGMSCRRWMGSAAGWRSVVSVHVARSWRHCRPPIGGHGLLAPYRHW